MKCQVDRNDDYRHILLFIFNQGCKVAKAVRDIRAVYDDDEITERNVQKCFSRFRDGKLLTFSSYLLFITLSILI